MFAYDYSCDVKGKSAHLLYAAEAKDSLIGGSCSECGLAGLKLSEGEVGSAARRTPVLESCVTKSHRIHINTFPPPAYMQISVAYALGFHAQEGVTGMDFNNGCRIHNHCNSFPRCNPLVMSCPVFLRISSQRHGQMSTHEPIATHADGFQ